MRVVYQLTLWQRYDAPCGQQTAEEIAAGVCDRRW